MIKVKDGYAKLVGTTASGSASHILLSNGSIKAVSDFAMADGTNATGTWNIDISGNAKSSTLSKYLLTGAGTECDANTLAFSDHLLRWYSSIPSTSSNLPTVTGWLNGLLALPLHSNGVTAQLYFSATKALFYRSMASDNWNQIAYTTSDITGNANTASKLQNKVKIWGLDFDGSSDVAGDLLLGASKILGKDAADIVNAGSNHLVLGYGSSEKGWPTYVDGNPTYFRYGTSHSVGMFLDSSGKVGIGNIAPQQKLDVSGKIKADALYLTRSNGDVAFTIAEESGTNGYNITASGGSSFIRFYTNSGGSSAVERMRIHTNGYVGIGTKSPQTMLHVAGGIYSTNLRTSSTILSEDYHLVYNCGSFSYVSSSLTGAIVIKLPITSSLHDMVNVEISIYEYKEDLGASKIIVGGHPWLKHWYYHTCSIIGNYNKGIRLGIYDGKYCIILGNNSTKWAYPGVYVTHIGTVYDDYKTSYLNKCTFSIVTDESGFSALVTPANVVKATSANISTYLRTQLYDSTTNWYDTYLFYTKWATRGSGSVLDLKCDGYQVRADIAKILDTSRNIYGNNFDGSADIGSNAIGSMRYLLFRTLDNDGNAGYIGRGSSGNNNLEFQNYTSDGKIILATGNRSNDLELNASGNLGIGGSPSYKFDVRSTSTTASYDLHYYNSNKKCSLFVGSDLFWYGNAKTSNSVIFNVQAGTISDGSGGKSVFQILGDGNVIASTFVGNLSGKASTANMISHSTYYYSNNVMKNTTTSKTIFGDNATANYLFPSFMEAHPKWSGHADVINFTGYCMWGGTQFATEYNAINPRVAIRKYNQSRSDWGDWTEFITEKNNYKVRDSGNSNEITFYYSTGGLTSNPSWLAAWNSYKLTYVSPSVLDVNYASKSTYLYACDSYSYGGSNPYYARLRWNTNSDDRWYLSVYPETPKAIAVDHSYNSDKLGGYNANTYFAYRGWDTDPGKDANTATMGSNFSYGNNCPYTGALLTFACGGYDLQFSSSYGSAGYLAFRTKNGDRSTWNSWTDLAIASNYVAKAGDTMTGSLTFSLSSSDRRIGIIGTYDPNRAAAIWSMGSSYQIAADGTSFGNLYGAAYAYFGSGYTFGANYSIGHSFVWCQNGTVSVALGTNIWTVGNCYAAHFYENSDIRYKTIINNVAIKANQLANLPLFDFKWLDNEDLLNTGTSAQAVQELLPYIVSGTDKLTLDYGVLGTIAGITACRELTEQEKEINKLKEQIKFLKDEINNLKTNKLWQS